MNLDKCITKNLLLLKNFFIYKILQLKECINELNNKFNKYNFFLCYLSDLKSQKTYKTNKTFIQ